MRVATSDVEDFITALVPALVPSPVPDTLVITESSSVARVFLGADVVEIVARQEVRGLVVARVVRIGAAARVHGAVVARDSLVLGAGVVLLGDALAASQALAASARLYLVGRRGLLVSP
jgi:predicted acyltransferase (DUF342 family)